MSLDHISQEQGGNKPVFPAEHWKEVGIPRGWTPTELSIALDYKCHWAGSVVPLYTTVSAVIAQ